MNYKQFIFCTAAIIGLQGCATNNTGNTFVSPSNPIKLAINKVDQDDQQAKLPIYELLLAELSLRRGDNDVAVENYLEVLEKADNPRIAERAVKIAAHAKDLNSAMLAATKWQISDPDNYQAYQVAGTLLFRQGKLDESYEQFKQAVEIRGKENRLSFSSILSLLSREKNPQGVLIISKKLADHYTENAYAQFMFASLATNLDQSIPALEYINRALAIEEIGEAHAIKAKLLLKLGNKNEAVKSLALAVKRHPENKDLHLTYARLLIDTQQYDKAEIEFNHLVEKAPDDADLLYTLGLLSLESNKLDAAEKHLSKLLSMGHRRGEAMYYLGRINENKDDLSQALNWYQQVNSGDFKFNAQIRAARLMAQLNDIEKAIESLNELKITNQNEDTLVRIYLTEAYIYRDIKQYEKAVDTYDIALLKIPSNIDLLYARALTSEKIGRLDILERDLLDILKQEPENVNALNALGFSLISDETRLDDAYYYIKKAIDLAPDEPAIIDSLGWVEFKRGNLKIAETLLRKAFSVLEDSEIAAHLVEVLWEMGKKAEAKSLLSRAIKTEPESSFLIDVKKRLKL